MTTTMKLQRQTVNAVRPLGLSAALWKASHAGQLALSVREGSLVSVKADGVEVDMRSELSSDTEMTQALLRTVVTQCGKARRELSRIIGDVEALEAQARASLPTTTNPVGAS